MKSWNPIARLRSDTSAGPSRRRRQRGAAALEVALVLGLVVIPLIEVVDEISERQADDVEARADRIGDPSGVAGYTPVGNNGTGGGTTSGGTTTTSTDADLTYSPSQSYNGHDWNVTLEISVADSSGTTQANGDLVGTWRDDTGVKIADATCSIDVNGLCTVTIKVKKSTVNPIVFHLDSLDSNELTLSSSAVTEFSILQN